jgi:hypothetical protein
VCHEWSVLYYRLHVEHKISNIFSVELTIPHKRSSHQRISHIDNKLNELTTNEDDENVEGDVKAVIDAGNN